MSGGSLNYFYGELESHAGDFHDKELDELVKDLSNLFYEREWYLSGDTNEGNWREARDAFKKKWFRGEARKERIEKILNEVKAEVLDSFGLSEEYCHKCKNWTPEREDDSPYGSCSLKSSCLMHRSERCEKFEKREES